MKTAILILLAGLTIFVMVSITLDLILAWFLEEDLGPETDSRSVDPLSSAAHWWQCAWCNQYFTEDHEPQDTCPETCHSHGICCQCAAAMERDEHLTADALTQPQPGAR
jgi:hypothetical protein